MRIVYLQKKTILKFSLKIDSSRLYNFHSFKLPILHVSFHTSLFHSSRDKQSNSISLGNLSILPVSVQIQKCIHCMPSKNIFAVCFLGLFNSDCCKRQTLIKKNKDTTKRSFQFQIIGIFKVENS